MESFDGALAEASYKSEFLPSSPVSPSNPSVFLAEAEQKPRQSCSQPELASELAGDHEFGPEVVQVGIDVVPVRACPQGFGNRAESGEGSCVIRQN